VENRDGGGEVVDCRDGGVEVMDWLTMFMWKTEMMVVRWCTAKMVVVR